MKKIYYLKVAKHQFVKLVCDFSYKFHWILYRDVLRKSSMCTQAFVMGLFVMPVMKTMCL